MGADLTWLANTLRHGSATYSFPLRRDRIHADSLLLEPLVVKGAKSASPA
jgi:hypothetical protein